LGTKNVTLGYLKFSRAFGGKLCPWRRYLVCTYDRVQVLAGHPPHFLFWCGCGYCSSNQVKGTGRSLIGLYEHLHYALQHIGTGTVDVIVLRRFVLCAPHSIFYIFELTFLLQEHCWIIYLE